MEIGNRTPERKILGELSNTKSEPISPTANLRLLTSLASNLKSVADNNYCVNKTQHNTSNNNNNNNSNNISESPIASGSLGNGLKLLPRKQKSLGLLCNKFLNMYPLNLDHETREISLDKTAKDLGTEKRRIYDIINVLESLDMASKAGKNRYLWHGQSNLTSTLVKLKSTAIRLGLREQIQDIQKNYRAYTNDNDETCDELTMSLEEPVDEETYCSDTAIKEDKSLGAMCQKFVMLFLVSMKNGVINLEIAAKVLILDNTDNQSEMMTDNGSRSRFKTKVRRLYDIANVLTAIGLIKKIYLFDRSLKKPIFKYFGPDVESTESFDADTPISKIYNSSIGMSTPDKRVTGHSHNSYVDTSANSNCKSFIQNCYSTPTIDKRKLRKRKLFDADSASFSRTNSLPNLDNKSRSLERLDDSILRVAEMELEKLNSTEELKPKACTKLLTRYKSDSCIKNHTTEHQTLALSSLPSPINQNVKTEPNDLILELGHETNNQSLMQSSNSAYQTLKVPPLINSKKLISTVVTTKPVHKIMKLIPIGSISTLQDPHSPSNSSSSNNNSIKKILVPKAVDVDSSNARVTKVARYKIGQTKPTRVINLTKIDPNKLIPIKRSDFKFSFADVKPLVVQQHDHHQQQVIDNTINLNNNSGYAMLTRIQATSVSPGDTFKAIKVGNTLQLVPLNSSNNNNDKSN
ncbi:transcription factor E2F7 [Microplitis demolitor]|uniref:transcription factor E2F7 n=1 Tax=Microplitis demolitor TaxID=69319 RepID=UPI0004CC9904|nr:transcription factor E2F7 [Microplitis demolitor]XP_053598219.1 transcription factor E2F7 [Microplitis demolitor]